MLWKKRNNAILGVIVGAAKAIVDIFKGLWDLIVSLTTDPLGFFKGIGNAVLHPVDIFNYMWGAVETAWERDVVNGDGVHFRGVFTQNNMANNVWFGIEIYTKKSAAKNKSFSTFFIIF